MARSSQKFIKNPSCRKLQTINFTSRKHYKANTFIYTPSSLFSMRKSTLIVLELFRYKQRKIVKTFLVHLLIRTVSGSNYRCKMQQVVWNF